MENAGTGAVQETETAAEAEADHGEMIQEDIEDKAVPLAAAAMEEEESGKSGLGIGALLTGALAFFLLLFKRKKDEEEEEESEGKA